MLPDLGVMTKADVEVKDESHLTKSTRALQSHILKYVVSNLKDALLTSYFNWKRGLKIAMFKAFEQVLSEVFTPGRAPTVSKTKYASPRADLVCGWYNPPDSSVQSLIYCPDCKNSRQGRGQNG